MIFDPSRPKASHQALLSEYECVNVLRQGRAAKSFAETLIDNDRPRFDSDLETLQRIQILQRAGIMRNRAQPTDWMLAQQPRPLGAAVVVQFTTVEASASRGAFIEAVTEIRCLSIGRTKCSLVSGSNETRRRGGAERQRRGRKAGAGQTGRGSDLNIFQPCTRC
jgi:hypothetical protein